MKKFVIALAAGALVVGLAVGGALAGSARHAANVLAEWHPLSERPAKYVRPTTTSRTGSTKTKVLCNRGARLAEVEPRSWRRLIP